MINLFVSSILITQEGELEYGHLCMVIRIKDVVDIAGDKWNVYVSGWSIVQDEFDNKEYKVVIKLTSCLVVCRLVRSSIRHKIASRAF